MPSGKTRGAQEAIAVGFVDRLFPVNPDVRTRTWVGAFLLHN